MRLTIVIPKRFFLFLLCLVLVTFAKAQLTGQDPKQKEVFDKLAELDSALFATVYTCDTAKTAAFFTEDLEFYHDKSGLTRSRKLLLESLIKNFCGAGSTKLRRELVKESLQVYLLDKYGAIQTGEHRFYVTENGQEHLSGKARFTHVWQFSNNQWRIARVLSYDHQEAFAPSTPSMKSTIYSEVLKEKRTFEVLLPPGYTPGSDTRYDVLYVLDGESNSAMTSQIQDFVNESGFMPKNIIVGVHNVNRDRDFTPTHVTSNGSSGGAANFLSFLKNELVPYINKTYSIKGSNTIFGHSLGGLFCMYALLNEPGLFDSYIAADPSFWWDNNYMDKLVAEKISALHSTKSLWITGRGGAESQNMGIPAIDSLLKARAPAELQWKVSEYPGETHNSIKFKSVYDGLRYIYTGFDKNIIFHPMNGILLKDKPAKVWLFSDPSSLRYTTDGTIPTANSAKMEGEIVLPGPSELTIRSFSMRGQGKIITGRFKAGEMPRAVAKPKNVKPGGLHYSYYEGAWDSLPDFKKLKPLLTGFADKDFRMDKFPRQTNLACLLEGYLETKAEGYYLFALDSDDGSRLYIGNQLVIDYDGLHGSGQDRSFILPLAKGFYPIRLEFFQREGGADLKLIYLTPDVKVPTPIQIPPELLYGN